ncbi:MAG: hypothetical protein VCE12_08475 [Candidatus Latescibacterota bacterium]
MRDGNVIPKSELSRRFGFDRTFSSRVRSRQTQLAGERHEAHVHACRTHFLTVQGCGGGSSTGIDEPDETADPGSNDDGRLTLANCAGSASVAAFYTDYFACTDILATTDGTRLSTDGLPPHPSAYYHSDDPNQVAFDDRGGTHRRNPNTIGVTNFAMTVLDNPVAKGTTAPVGSLWEDTAGDPVECTDLAGEEDVECEVAIIGAGVNGTHVQGNAASLGRCGIYSLLEWLHLPVL